MEIVLEFAGLDQIMPGVDRKEAAIEEQHVHGLNEAAYERIEDTGKFAFFDWRCEEVSYDLGREKAKQTNLKLTERLRVEDAKQYHRMGDDATHQNKKLKSIKIEF